MSDEELPEIARKIRDAIEATGETQAEIARRAGINRDMMNRYIRGVTPPPLPKILSIARALNIDPQHFDDRAPSLLDIEPAPFDLTITSKDDGGASVNITADLRSLEDAVDLANSIKKMMVRFKRR